MSQDVSVETSALRNKSKESLKAIQLQVEHLSNRDRVLISMRKAIAARQDLDITLNVITDELTCGEVASIATHARIRAGGVPKGPSFGGPEAKYGRLEVIPFVISEGVRIYSSSPIFVGQVSSLGRIENVDPKIDELLTKASLPDEPKAVLLQALSDASPLRNFGLKRIDEIVSTLPHQ